MMKKSASGLFLPNRREVLTLAAGAASLIAMPSIVRAETPYKKSLRLQSLNSGEKLTVTYWTDQGYEADALKRVSWFMRDLRTGDVHDVHPALLDLLWEIDSHTRSKNPIYAMSGYRSPKTNAWLDARGNGVDPGSFHMRGMAIDIRNSSVMGRRQIGSERASESGIGVMSMLYARANTLASPLFVRKRTAR